MTDKNAVHKPETPEPFVDCRTAGQFLGFTATQVRRLAEAGKVRAYQYGLGRRKYWRFKLSELANGPEALHSTPSPVAQR